MKQALTVLLLSIVFACAPHHLFTSPSANDGARIFQPPPSGPSAAGAVRFVALGDTGTGGATQYAVARRMAAYHDERPFDLVIMLGDNIYGRGGDAAFDLRDKFERPYAELLRRGVRFHAALGNHDARDAQLAYPDFNMRGRPFYSFERGDGLVEFFVLDSTRDGRQRGGQLRWLEGALAASKARWKVAYFHHPIYSSGRAHGSDLPLRALFEPLFARHGVAAVFSGHDHFYERTRPQRGVLYFVAGAGGKLRRGDINRASPFLAAGNDEVNSFVYAEATREQFCFWAVGADGGLLDQLCLAPPQA